MNVQLILQSKGQQVHSISSGATLADVVQLLMGHNCGSLLVIDDDQVVGIVTERDILRACASDPRPLGAIRVHEKMTRELVVGSPQDPLSDVMGLLTSRRIRHLPILEGSRLVGLISIGDVVKAQHDRLSLENHLLKEYIQG